jgi:hypothetical protein
VTGRVELTRFTTKAGYDKDAGVAAKPRSLELWRVRYPLSEINQGNCVSSEYRGYLRIDYDPARVPNTAPDGTVYVITLGPKTGGSTQAFYFLGDDLFKGQSPELDPHLLDRWSPELDPSREYCATISAFGDGDLARLPITSESLCASVKQLSSYPDDAGSSAEQPDALPTSTGTDPVFSAPSNAGAPLGGCATALGTRRLGARGPVFMAALLAWLAGRRKRSRRP